MQRQAGASFTDRIRSIDFRLPIHSHNHFRHRDQSRLSSIGQRSLRFSMWATITMPPTLGLKTGKTQLIADNACLAGGDSPTDVNPSFFAQKGDAMQNS